MSENYASKRFLGRREWFAAFGSSFCSKYQVSKIITSTSMVEFIPNILSICRSFLIAKKKDTKKHPTPLYQGPDLHCTFLYPNGLTLTFRLGNCSASNPRFQTPSQPQHSPASNLTARPGLRRPPQPPRRPFGSRRPSSPAPRPQTAPS